MLPTQAMLMTKMGAVRYALFFYLEAKSGPVRAWTGVGDYELPADGVDLTGGKYLGIGLLGDIPALRQLIGGVAERVDFSLSGADKETVKLADRDADEVRGARVSLGIIFFDDEWQPADQLAWVWSGKADVPTVARSSGESGQTMRTVTLSTVTEFNDRTRADLSYYVDADQRRRSPTDAFCSRVSRYGGDSTIVWPGN